MRAHATLSALLLSALLSGCIFCGPTVYHLSGVTAGYAASGEWEDERIRAGFEAAGLTPRGASESSISAGDGNVSVSAYRREGSPHELLVSFEADAQGTREEAERAGDARIGQVEEEARRIAATIAAHAGWTLTQREPLWDKGLLHGDC